MLLAIIESIQVAPQLQKVDPLGATDEVWNVFPPLPFPCLFFGQSLMKRPV